ncbi:MAG: hypothetical protein ACYC3A_06220 [Halothiobacillus sp.]
MQKIRLCAVIEAPYHSKRTKRHGAEYAHTQKQKQRHHGLIVDVRDGNAPDVIQFPATDTHGEQCQQPREPKAKT